MKITVLNDNCAGNGCLAEHGLSFLIESDITLLFDTGPSDVIFRNAKVLGIDLSSIKTIVLSHGHYDHTGGLPYFGGQDLICHPFVFNKHLKKLDGKDIGSPLSLDEATAKFNLKLNKEPFWLSEKVVFLGEIPRLNNFESSYTNFQDKWGNDDFIKDDSAIAIKTDKGLVVVSGCAHSGICNIVDYAIRVTGESNIYAVVGGFHLKDTCPQTIKTVEYLQSINVKKVIPSHCTEFPALVVFHEVWPLSQIKSGRLLNF